MRVLVIAAVLAGCGSKPPRRERPVGAQAAAVPVSEAPSQMPVFGRPPRFRLIGALTGPTWPLVGAPSLEPHYRVSSPWFASCERRGRLPDDALAYVEAWCRYRADPTGFDLLAALLPLRRSTISGLGDAVYRDIGNFVVDSRPAQAALTWVATAVNREPAFYELLVAVYLDLGRIDDAMRAAQEFIATRHQSCGRELVELTLAFELPTSAKAFAAARVHGATSPCGARLHRLGCLIAAAELTMTDPDLVAVIRGAPGGPACDGILDGDETAAAAVFGLYLRWSRGASVDATGIAGAALFVHDAEELQLAAFEMQLAMSCAPIAEIQMAASRIQTSEYAQPRHDARRKRLVEMTPARCEQLRKR